MENALKEMRAAYAKMTGKFIVFEGIDGCGKSTQFSLFSKYLFEKSKYNHLVLTREPYKSREIRRVMAEDKDAYSNPEKCAELFISDRKRHISEIISPSLNKNLIVLCDRYKYSTLAYQWTQGLDVISLIEKHKGMPIPGLVFLIDIPVNVALERMKIQADGREGKFESDSEFLKKLRENYINLQKILNLEPILLIDGNQPVEKVHSDIVKIYEERFSP